MAYLENRLLNRMAFGVSVLAGVLLIGGAYLSIRNPQIYTHDDLKKAHTAGTSGQGYLYGVVQNHRAKSLGLLFGSMGLGALYLASRLAQPDPVTLAPASVEVTGTSPEISETTSDADVKALIEDCRAGVMAFLSEHKFIRSAYYSKGLAIIGDQGTGKSNFADQLCQFRQITRGDHYIVCDPHYAKNKAQGLYQTADEVFGTPDEISAGLRAAIDKALNTLREDEHGHKNRRVVILLDEFSNWHKKYGLEDLAREVMNILSQDLRKSVLSIVVVAHGDKKGQLGGKDLETGVHDSVLDQCCVLKLKTAPSLNEEDEDPAWTGQGKISLRNETYDGGKKKKFQLPDVLHPATWPKDLGPYIRAAINAVRPPKASAKQTATEIVTDAARQWNETPKRPNYDLVDVPALNGDRDDWRALFEIEKAFEFCQWLVKKEMVKGGKLKVSAVRDNWAKHHGFDTASTLQFLSSVNRLGLGQFDNVGEPKEWISRVEYTSIPQPSRVD